ncbi:30S ribosomal protein S16 [Streptomyces sp. 3MP-14]|uniref:Small ribosomal subunit protein bS16 n=1 Tax=Streptomyces mimosae TaxID=2586635 RepID=A0A5N6A054_9ACTN|nr:MULTISPECIES: 30S ribosomal protein S16 [Streptomyces]KAB8161562.1 30S ribosomal protein S16 [Streptomyces mimosae]KAB8173501.1 30S ribosomal protein S16 [Streptomyces sp. 3MP-14]
MAVKIKLKRLGKIRSPHYRIIVADARTRRDGRAIEEIGLYHPVQNPSRIEVNSERVQHWLSVGAQPTEPVLAILKATGDWQKFRGLPAPPPLKEPAARPDRRAAFEAAAKESGGEPKGEAITPKAKKAEKKAEAPAESSEG